LADEEGLEQVAPEAAGAGGGGFPTWAIWLIVGAVIVVAIVVVVVVLFVVDSGPPNQEPTISGLVPASTSVAPGGSTVITCTATDADGDTLTYSWQASGGLISGSSSSETWQAPATEGTYSIQCDVEDGRGGSDTRDITITVEVGNSAPVITSVTPGSATVPPGGSTTVTCTATDADGDTLTYSWQASLGTISGTGSSVTWDAPMAEGTYSIQCDVEDGRGGNAHRSTNVEVAVVVTAGSINIQSTPPGASVFLDGVNTGSVTPYTINNVPAGPHTVLLRKEGYKDRQEVVAVTAGVESTINWVLTCTPMLSLTLQPDAADGKDTYVWSGDSGANYETIENLYTSVLDPTNIARTFIEFDLSGIPATSIVTSADLGLYYWGDGASPLEGPVGAYRITSNWNEGTVTWDAQPNTLPTPVDIISIPVYVAPGYKYWELDSLVQGWVSGTIANHGVMLKDANEATLEDYKNFRSSDWGTASQRPKLIIDYYDPVP
jgi:hypothetical protein